MYREGVKKFNTIDLVDGKPDNVDTETWDEGYISLVECQECNYKGHPREFGLEPTLEEALRGLGDADVVRALDKGWKPDLEKTRAVHRDHITEFTDSELEEMYNDEVFGDDPSITREVKGLYGYFQVAAEAFLYEGNT